MLIRWRCNRSVGSEVYPHSVSHEGFAVELATDLDSILLGVERAHNTGEGLQRSPGSESGRRGNDVPKTLEMVRTEDFGVLKVCDQEGVRGRRGSHERRDGG